MPRGGLRGIGPARAGKLAPARSRCRFGLESLGVVIVGDQRFSEASLVRGRCIKMSGMSGGTVL